VSSSAVGERTAAGNAVVANPEQTTNSTRRTAEAATSPNRRAKNVNSGEEAARVA